MNSTHTPRPDWCTDWYLAMCREFFAKETDAALDQARIGVDSILAATGDNAVAPVNRPGFEAIRDVVLAEQRARRDKPNTWILDAE